MLLFSNHAASSDFTSIYCTSLNLVFRPFPRGGSCLDTAARHMPCLNVTGAAMSSAQPAPSSNTAAFTTATHRSSPAQWYKCMQLFCRLLMWLQEGCGRTYTRQPNLNAHMRSRHSADLPFPCPVDNCGASFAWKATLKKHVERGHDENVGEMVFNADDV